MPALRLFTRFRELLDIATTRAEAAWLRLNSDGSADELTRAQTLAALLPAGVYAGRHPNGHTLTITGITDPAGTYVLTLDGEVHGDDAWLGDGLRLERSGLGANWMLYDAATSAYYASTSDAPDAPWDATWDSVSVGAGLPSFSLTAYPGEYVGQTVASAASVLWEWDGSAWANVAVDNVAVNGAIAADPAATRAALQLGSVDAPTFDGLTLNNGTSASTLLIYGSDNGAGVYTRAKVEHAPSGDLTISTEANSATAGNIWLAPGSGRVVFPSGQYQTPSLTFEDSTTGFYRPALDRLGLTIGGTRTLAVYSRGLYMEAGKGIGAAADRWMRAGSDGIEFATLNAGGALINIAAANITASGTLKTTATVYASLPAASTAGAGARAFITDCISAAFLATASGDGTNAVPVVSDGTNWLVG